MFKHPRSGNGAVLGDVPDKKDRYVVPLASTINLPADSRTWLTLPGADSRDDVQTVWIESTTMRLRLEGCGMGKMASREFSARISSPLWEAPRRSPRRRVWEADSSPDTYSTWPAPPARLCMA